MKKLSAALAVLSLAVISPVPVAAQSGPAVKISRSGICHSSDGTCYSWTVHHTPYPGMAACIRAGGRPPWR